MGRKFGWSGDTLSGTEDAPAGGTRTTSDEQTRLLQEIRQGLERLDQRVELLEINVKDLRERAQGPATAVRPEER